MAVQIKEGGGVFSDINITPLTDIFLVLLIIFMVTTSVTIESAAHVDLPKSEVKTNPEEKPKGVLVTLTEDRQIWVNDKNVTEHDLDPAIRDALGKSAEKLVIFQGDPHVILGDMVHILDIAKGAGAEQIAIAVAKFAPGSKGAPAGGPAGGSM